MSKGLQFYIQQANEAQKRIAEHRKTVKTWKFDTIAVHGIYSLEETMNNQGSIAEPLFLSTSQAYRDSDEMEAGLSYQMPTWAYSRIHNPTVYYLEETLALLETYSTELEATALCTSSGMSAIKQAIEPLLENRENKPLNFVTPSQIYGGSYQLFNVRMPERGAAPHWVADSGDIESWRSQIDENTRFLYAEIPTNPQQSCFDVEAVANLAHEHGIPLIVDSTIATPTLHRPLQFGADIVVQSLTKTIGSSGTAIGGAIIARHNLTSKHLSDQQKENYAFWLKLLPFRDSGPCISPANAYVFLNEIKTLRTRMKHYSENATAVVNFLKTHPKVEKIDYLGLEDHKHHTLAKKYMKLVDSDIPMFGHLMSIYIKGDLLNTRQLFDKLNLFRRATDLGRTKSIATICAISTHQQQGEEGQKRAGIPGNLVRLCIGGEDPQDIINDLKQALE